MLRTVHVLALASALGSAAATIFIRQGLRSHGPYTGFWINLAVGTLGLWVAVILTGGLGRVSVTGLAFFVLAGLIGTVAGRLLRFVSIEQVGASISAALIGLSPLFSAAFAILLLGERITIPIAAGTVVIVAGTVLLSAGGRRIGVQPGRLVLPLLSGACFGVVAVLRKIGLSDTGPVVGSAVNATTALFAFTAFLLVSGQREAMACRGRGLAHFVVAGVMENGAVFLTILALSMGAVSVVVPLTGTAPIFVLLLSPFFLKGVEVLNSRVVLGTLLVVAGIYLITALAGP
ncbi:MAG: EamA family transporter [Candidatus Rokuibacteriota bacterium]